MAAELPKISNPLPFPGVTANGVRKSAFVVNLLLGFCVLLVLLLDAIGIANTANYAFVLVLSLIAVGLIERLAKALSNIEKQIQTIAGAEAAKE
jgi:hypothetical protein